MEWRAVSSPSNPRLNVLGSENPELGEWQLEQDIVLFKLKILS
tara:strand:+ start:16832 stop:16960 length:129 start_codon:yes stop_codon:yes gene_type:complete